MAKILATLLPTVLWKVENIFNVLGDIANEVYRVLKVLTGCFFLFIVKCKESTLKEGLLNIKKPGIIGFENPQPL